MKRAHEEKSERFQAWPNTRATVRFAYTVALAILGLYLAMIPVASYAFASHNPKCPCHSPWNQIRMRIQMLQEIRLW